MRDLSARQYDAHYRRLGLAPGSGPAAIDTAAMALRAKLSPERLNEGPLKEIAPIRLVEIGESALLLIDYWQRHGIAPPSIQSRYLAGLHDLAGIEAVPAITKEAEQDAFKVPRTLPVLIAEPDEKDNQAHLFPPENESEITFLEPVGPQAPQLNFSYSLFKKVDGAVSPNADLIKSRSIIGLIVLAIIWVVIPLLLVKTVAFIFEDCGIERWLDYFSVLAKVIPVCFVPPLVMYEYAFFRQLQFPFAGALRLPVAKAIDNCVERLTVASIGNSAGWTVESKHVQEFNGEVVTGAIVAAYSGTNTDRKVPLKIHMRIEKLSDSSSFLVYWFELDWRLLFKGKAVSRMKSARFELDRLIKES